MNGQSSEFIGSIPENYDRGLGPYIFEDYAEDIAERAGAIEARSVLELAAGTGIVSRKLRDRLQPDAHLVVTDLNPPMLDIAKGKFASDENVTFIPANAMALPFGEAEFDQIVCQFGVMFFPDKRLSFMEAIRVLRPGGRYLFNTWGQMAENPFSEIAHGVTARFFPDNPPGFYQVPYSYADPAVVIADMAAAGFKDVEYETLSLNKKVASWEQFARGLVFGNPLIDEIESRGGVDPNDIAQEILSAFGARWGSAPASMPLRSTVFSGRAP